MERVHKRMKRGVEYVEKRVVRVEEVRERV